MEMGLQSPAPVSESAIGPAASSPVFCTITPNVAEVPPITTPPKSCRSWTASRRAGVGGRSISGVSMGPSVACTSGGAGNWQAASPTTANKDTNEDTRKVRSIAVQPIRAGMRRSR